MNDTFWQSVRYLLIAALAATAGSNAATVADITKFIDAVFVAAPAVGAVGTMAWGFYVKWRTRAVPLATALRADVPTVNAATGATEPGSSHTK